jgi:hypothetical protein
VVKRVGRGVMDEEFVDGGERSRLIMQRRELALYMCVRREEEEEMLTRCEVERTVDVRPVI